jgi:hypothetical protein
MLLKEKTSGHIVEVLDLNHLGDCARSTVRGRLHYGEEAQDPEPFDKQVLCFLSGEDLPRCWMDPHYRDEDLARLRRRQGQAALRTT